MDEPTEPQPAKDREILQDDTEDVAFSPNIDTGFGLMTVVIYGNEIEIHRTHGLANSLAAVYAGEIAPFLRHPTAQQGLGLNTEVHAPRIKAGDYEGLFVRLRQDFPRLDAKLIDLVRADFLREDTLSSSAEQYGRNSSEYAAEVEKSNRPLDEANLREYFFSKAFDAMVIIANEIDLEAPLSALCDD